jgi:hypothetical protein
MKATYKVFLNFPYDQDFKGLSIALQFAVVAKGLVPVCGKDMIASDKIRIYNLTDAISGCRFSIHDLSRNKGEGEDNFMRGNMPLEAGMALFNAFNSQRNRDKNDESFQHRFLLMTSQPHEHTIFASDLNGLDPMYHQNDEIEMITKVYTWLNNILKSRPELKSLPITRIKEIYQEFISSLKDIKGGETSGEATHEETRELMYRICESYQLWDFRYSMSGREEFPEAQIQFNNKPPESIQNFKKQRMSEKDKEP